MAYLVTTMYYVNFCIGFNDGDADSLESGYYSENTLKLLCGCGKCSLEKLLTNGCDDPNRLKKFPLLNVIELPNVKKQQYLTSLLEDANKLNEEFAELCDEICESFIQTEIPLQRIVNFLKNSKFLLLSVRVEELRKKLENATGMYDVFSVLSDVCSWFNHHPLGMLVKKFGSNNERRLYKKFVDENVMKYLNRSVTEIPIDTFGSENIEGSRFMLKIDSPSAHENITGQQLLVLKKKAAEALLVENENLKIVTIEDGCLEVEFLLPEDVFKETFPLLPEQVDNVAKISIEGLKVKYIKYGDHCHEFPVNKI